jgi:methyl halide transferase
MVTPIDSSSYWDEKYKRSETPWDLNSPTPLFMEILKNLPRGKMLIPGCGKGFDAIAASNEGFEVTAVDFAPSAIQAAEAMAEKQNANVKFAAADFFHLEEEYFNSYDYVYDYTSYCAINPTRRKEYAEIISRCLKPGGKLIALLFPVDGREGGPPFNVDVIEFYKLFSSFLKLDFSSRRINSIKPRKGREVLQIYVKP